jgi:hypothetical protein
MAITDYIPNIFGQAAPSYLPGLLGAEETQNLQNRANVQGLLGAGLALAQGMSRTGPRRSAAENILGAISGGFGAAGGAYDQGIKNYVTQQQIAQTQLAQTQAANKLKSIADAKRLYPDIASLADIDPGKFAEEVALRERLKGIGGTQGAGQMPTQSPDALRAQAQRAYMAGPNFKALGDSLMEQADRLEVQGTQQVVAPQAAVTQVQPPQAQPQVAPTQEVTVDQKTQEKILPPVLATEKPATSRIATLNAQADTVRKEMDRLSDPRLAANKSVQNAFERNKTKLEEIRKQISEAAVAETDLKEFRANAPQQFQQQIDNLQQLSMTGQLTPDQLSQRMGDISKQINEYNQKETEFKRKQADYSVEARRIAKNKFKKNLEDLTSDEAGQLDKLMFGKDKELKVAGRSLVTQTVYGDKEFLKRRIEGAVNAEEQAIGAINVANDVRGIVDVLKPYTGGKLDEFKASIGSYLPDTSMSQISTANDLAVAIRARVAPTLRVPGSGATSDFETKQFLAAIPSLAQYPAGRELIAVYTEKLAQRAVAAADVRSQMIEAGNYSVKNFQQALKDQGLDRVFTNAELATLRSGKAPTEIGSGLPQSVKDKYNLK